MSMHYSGVDMDTGKIIGVNLTKWAAVPERTRIKNLQDDQ
jgi:hypothetical protein